MFFWIHLIPVVYAIDKVVNHLILNLFKPRLLLSMAPNMKIYFKVPYLDPLSSTPNAELCKIFACYFPKCDTHLISVNSSTMGLYLKFKNSLPLLHRASVVYVFKCAVCNASYMSQTGLQLHVTAYKNLKVSLRSGRPLTNSEHWSIRDHDWCTGHLASVQDFKILCPAFSELHRRILESLYIKNLSSHLYLMVLSRPLLYEFCDYFVYIFCFVVIVLSSRPLEFSF